MRIVAIAACDEERGIGRRGDIPWSHPEDLKRFREETMGHPVIMGRATVASLPGRLRGRMVVLVSSGGTGDPKADATARCLDEALERACLYATGKAFLAGGARIYEEGLPLAHEALLTRVPGSHGCDRFIPELGDGWLMAGTQPAGALTVERWTRPDRRA